MPDFTVKRADPDSGYVWIVTLGDNIIAFNTGAVQLADGGTLHYNSSGTTTAPDGGTGAPNGGAGSPATDGGVTTDNIIVPVPPSGGPPHQPLGGQNPSDGGSGGGVGGTDVSIDGGHVHTEEK